MKASLRAADRAADARARIYAGELRTLIRTARAAGSWSVPVSALEALADRMESGGTASQFPRPKMQEIGRALDATENNVWVFPRRVW